MNFVLSFLIPALIAVTINDFIKNKMIKNEKDAVIYLAIRILVIVILAVLTIFFVKNQLLIQAFITFAFGLNVTFPRFKKKHKL
jgi:pheromone shutdown protein TraB